MTGMGCDDHRRRYDIAIIQFSDHTGTTTLVYATHSSCSTVSIVFLLTILAIFYHSTWVLMTGT
jgi:hypothetical protein